MSEQHKLPLDDIIGRPEAFCIFDDQLQVLAVVSEVSNVFDGSFDAFPAIILRGYQNEFNLAFKVAYLASLFQQAKNAPPPPFKSAVERFAVDCYLLRVIFGGSVHNDLKKPPAWYIQSFSINLLNFRKRRAASKIILINER